MWEANLRRALVGLIAVLGWALAAITAAQAEINFAEAAKERFLGKDDAPLTVVEYASLTCSHCANFHTKTLPAFKAKYIDTGKIKLVFRDYPLDGVALRGSMLARCAAPDRFFTYIDSIFRSQEGWIRSPDPVKALIQVVRLGGMSQADADTCLQNKELSESVVNSRMQAEQSFNVRSTPSFVINGKTYPGAFSIEEFDKILEPLLPKP